MAETLEQFEGSECSWYDAPCHLSNFADWFADYALWIPRKIFELLMEPLGVMIKGMPMPDWVADASIGFSGVPPHVAFFLEFLYFGEGVAIIMSAYDIRFLIRRLPVIG